MTTRTQDAIPHPARAEIELAAVLHALSDPVRLRIVCGLAAAADRSCGSFDLAATTSTRASPDCCGRSWTPARADAGARFSRAGLGAGMNERAAILVVEDDD